MSLITKWFLAQVPEGPLVPWLKGFADAVSDQGYARWSIGRRILLAAGFSRWLEQKNIDLRSISSGHPEQYLRYRACRQRVHPGDPSALRHLLDYLRIEAVIPAETIPVGPETEVQRCVQAYERYLREARGLAPATILNYVPFVRAFLEHRFGTGQVTPASLCAGDVVGFVQRMAPGMNRKRAKIMTTALRSFLQHLRYRDEAVPDLVAAVPIVANWSMPSIPRAISADQVQRLLSSIDRTTAMGRRDYAIVLLFARLGLRLSEVTFLELDDIDWRTSTLTVRTKGGSRNDFPLSHEVGEAIAEYLRHWPAIEQLPPRVPSRQGADLRISQSRRCRLGDPPRARTRRRRCADSRGSPVSPRSFAGDDAPRGLARRDWRRARSSPSRHHQDLRQGGPGRPAPSCPAVAGRCAMNTLREALEEYLGMRRVLGFKLQQAGRALLDFVTFMEQRQAPVITQALALAWAQRPRNVQPATWAARLGYVRVFARHRQATDPRTEVPSPGLLPFKPRRATPYLYSDEQIRNLLQAALHLPHRYRQGALLPWVHYCLLGLLSVSGLRVAEARNLELRDVDLDAAVLTVREAKFGRTRLVPLHSTTCEVLADYIARRRRQWADRSVSPYLFISSRGNRLDGFADPPCFLRRLAPDRSAGQAREPRTASARLQTFVRHPHIGELVSLREGPGATLAGAVDLPGARAYRRYPMVSGGLSRADGRGHAPP